MTNWYSVTTSGETDRLLAAWPDAPVDNEETCGLILSTAREQIVAYAPVTAFDVITTYPADKPDFTKPADRLVYAQLLQAQRLWNAGRADENGNVGTEGFSFTPRPLDKTVRQIIRPTGGVPNVF
ncbi:hypothetical protein [Microbacterium invictum]|uniref:Head-to-tail adaptor n=1 Tax=Microbacterium invictum TaxID=515415 RepID=A0ABZ0VEA8_9MICO|nr:hypothetical protein [Microbacterium invictum]WQB71965.1 hypothetical protein T9R20_08480 [Microbacterium invictum]